MMTLQKIAETSVPGPPAAGTAVEPPRTGRRSCARRALGAGLAGGRPVGAVRRTTVSRGGSWWAAAARTRSHGCSASSRPGNRSWAHAASALVLVAAQTADETGRSRPWALFDAGQAVAALSVQAEADGLSVHQMGGFDADAARNEFDLEEALTPLVVLAVGRRDPDAQLPEPLAARERAPRSREPLQALMLTAPEDSTRRVA